MSEPFTYDRFEPGRAYGEQNLVLDATFLDDWDAIFPGRRNRDELPAGVLAAIIMRAYTAIIAPRPPGNIHGSQSYDIVRLPLEGERLTTSFACEAKEVRKGRRLVILRSETRIGDETICIGRMTSIVAA